MLTAVIKVYENNEMKKKLDNKLTQPIKINNGFRQGCHISPTVLNMYINQIITEWKEEEIEEIKILRSKDIKTLWFVDDLFNVADSGDALQISVHKLETATNWRQLATNTD